MKVGVKKQKWSMIFSDIIAVFYFRLQNKKFLVGFIIILKLSTIIMRVGTPWLFATWFEFFVQKQEMINFRNWNTNLILDISENQIENGKKTIPA